MRSVLLTTGAQLSQALVSFLSTLVFVRVLSPNEFGAYAGILSIWTLLLALNRAALGEQLLAGNVDSEGYAEFVIVWSGVGLVVTVGVTWFVADPIVAASSAYAVLFAASDALRYKRFARSTASSGSALTLLVDAVRVLITLVSLLLVQIYQLAWPAAVMILASAMIWPAMELIDTRSLNLGRAFGYLRRRGSFELAMTAQFVIGTGASQALPFLALAAYGPAAFGHIKLAQSLVAPVALVGTAFAPSIIRLVGSTRDARSQVKLTIRLLCGAVGLASVVSLATIVVLGVFGSALVPDHSWISIEPLIVPATVLTTLVLVGQPGGALIRVRRYASVAIIGQLAGVLISWIICLWSLHISILGFSWALAIGSGATVTCTYALLALRLARDHRGR